MALNRRDIENLLEAVEYLKSASSGQSDHFRELEAFCLFVGYPKSGHSLIGALLDAHPDMVIAHELDCLRCLRAGLGREPIFALLLEIAADFHASDHDWNGHRYKVENQWQGRFRRLRVIGDKKGGGTSRQLLMHPRLLDRLHATVELPIKFIHVVRHPADNIGAISRQFGVSLEESAGLYFSMAKSVALLKKRLAPGDFCEIAYEDFIRSPPRHLEEICRFLGQEAPADYLRDCAAIVSPPRASRDSGLAWTPALRERVVRSAAGFEFLAHYRFGDP